MGTQGNSLVEDARPGAECHRRGEVCAGFKVTRAHQRRRDGRAHRRTRFVIGAAIALLMTIEPLAAAQQAKPSPPPARKLNRTPSAARQRILSARPLAMYYSSDDARGLESLRAHAADMTLLGPQSFVVEADGVVRGSVPREIAEGAEHACLPIMPLVVNPGFDRATAGSLLHSARARDRAATYLAYLARRENLAGFQIDLENIDPGDKTLFTSFVALAAARLHRDGRLVSVAVVPRFSDRYPGESKSGEFKTGQWGASYDYRALGRVVDFMTIMTYDQHGRLGSPGPIAGYAWVEEALDYAAQRVPRQKLLLGVPFYGRDWSVTDGGTLARSLTFKEATALREKIGTPQQWDERWCSPWFEYREGSAQHTVWFEDRKSLEEKLRLMRRLRLRGFAAWRLGAEDPEFWALEEAAQPDINAHTESHAAKPHRRLAARRVSASLQ